MTFVFNKMIAQDKEEIILKHQIAMGGLKTWKQIKTISCTYHRSSNLTTIEEKMQTILGESMRIDLTYKTRANTIPNKPYFINIHKQKGWKYLPDNIQNKIEPLSQEDIDYYIKHPYFSDILLSTNPKIYDLSIETSEGKDYYKLDVSSDKNIQQYYYIDTQTYLLYKSTEISAATESEWFYTDYKRLKNGALIPYHISTKFEEIELKNYITNQPISESVFYSEKK